MLLSEVPSNNNESVDKNSSEGGDAPGANAAKRLDMSPTMEQYVEAIAHLLQQDKVCTVSEIAEAAQVTRPAASRAVRGLVDRELVVHKSYGYVDLTDKGQQLAEQLSTRHRALYEFFTEVLDMDRSWSDNEACRLEHQIDDNLIKRLEMLRNFLGGDTQRQDSWRDYLEAETDTGKTQLLD